MWYCLPMPDAANALRQIDTAREELTKVLGECPTSGARIAKVLAALQSLEREFVADAGEKATSRRRGPKEAKTVEDYRVEKFPSRPAVLAEYRSTDAEPFRCPKDIVFATATAVQDLKQCKFVDLHEAVQKALGERVPDYHIRTALRWMKHEQLIRHERAMFSPAKAGSLKSQATKAWKQLEAES